MSSVMIATICNKCQFKTPEMWITRDHRGYPSLDGLVCGSCGARNCITRDWQDNEVHAVIPPVEDGNINRFEYSYRDENGKKHSQKVDPKIVEKHFKNSNK